MEKKYTIEVIQNDNSSLNISRNNEGFTILELIGIVESIRSDLITQLASFNKSDMNVTRQFKTKKVIGTIDVQE